MRLIKQAVILSIILLGCVATTKKPMALQNTKYYSIIEDYLDSKKIEPTLVYNVNSYEFKLLNHKFSWKEEEKGISVTIDGTTIITNDKVTLNNVWGRSIDSLKYLNALIEVKIYEDLSIIGMVMNHYPCNGLGCGANYQIIYDYKNQKVSSFGRFRTGFEFELYHFNSDYKPDYLSKTYYGRNRIGIDTTEFVMYSQTEKGNFELFKSKAHDKYWFQYIYPEFNQEGEEHFIEDWITQIIKE